MDMSGWQLSGDAPAAYARYAYILMEPWTDDLISQALCEKGERVLDIACGTGLVASRVNLVSNAECKVTGIDINEGMLNVAKKNANVEWHLGSATELPFKDGSFDVVLCQQGLQYFPDRAAAAREMARVLIPGGRVSLNVWGSLDRQPFYVALVDSIGEFLGAEAATAFDLAFSLNTSEELRQLADDAGLRDIKVRFEHRTIRFHDLREMVAGFMQATPIAGQFMSLSEDRRNAFVGRVSELLKGYVDDAGMAVPQENHYLTATR
jgi:ubiquinone/menaquinone biosynthesis C-methylase UbiE